LDFYFVTSNENKLREANKILNLNLLNAKLEIPEIQSLEVKDIIVDKAKKAYEMLQKPVLVEDTGLYINKLNGFPGALVKWVLKGIGAKGICNLLTNQTDRSAYAKTGLCIYDGSSLKTFYGRVDGTITEEPKGTTRFGWDIIFQPKGYDATFAQMTEEEKNKISMRAKAFAQLKDHLNTDLP
jgi:non-canonical purine NTP pyrophosphatase (RdgB/HAM1 family)